MNRRASIGFSVGATLEKIAEVKSQNAEVKTNWIFAILTFCILTFDFRLALRSGQVRAFRGIDLNLFSFVDEWRHLHHQSGLSLGGLSYTGSGGALQSGFGLNHG